MMTRSRHLRGADILQAGSGPRLRSTAAGVFPGCHQLMQQPITARCDPRTQQQQQQPITARCAPRTQQQQQQPITARCAPRTQQQQKQPITARCDPRTQQQQQQPITARCDPRTQQQQPITARCDPRTQQQQQPITARCDQELRRHFRSARFTMAEPDWWPEHLLKRRKAYQAIKATQAKLALLDKRKVSKGKPLLFKRLGGPAAGRATAPAGTRPASAGAKPPPPPPALPPKKQASLSAVPHQGLKASVPKS
ncbi:hypothetical protein CRUP_022694 [Coryphaenoides rupestris]|nr:hypothetical protein CRUP_022694 [Coryphaenoides rupestris]